MADPAAVPDAQGEFLELGNPGEDTLLVDSLRIDAGSQRLVLGRLRVPPGGAMLICRDTLPAENGDMRCDAGWPALGLANGKAARVSLASAGWRNDFDLPASRPGVSWENTWDAAAGFAAFLPSRGAWNGGDSATPGGRNTRSLREPARNLGITAVTWEARPGATGEGALRVSIADRGRSPAGAAWLALRLDADWDGEAEILIDSLPFAPGKGAEISFPVGAGMRGQARAAIAPGPSGRDEDPADDVFLYALEPSRPLAFSECHPAPAAGEPEWVEIRNRTADSGGTGRALDLSRAALNGWPLGARAGSLEPGGYAVLTADAEAFRARFGPIKARVLRPEGWRALRNTGDTLILSLGGAGVDTLAYGAPVAGSAGPGTPGFPDPAPEPAGWAISGRLASDIRPLEVEVRAPPGSAYGLRVFDLEGNCVRGLGSGGAGRRSYAWDGRGDGGRRLPAGPYVLWLGFAHGRTFKRAVLAEVR